MADAEEVLADAVPQLKGLKGISDAVLEAHFKLYEGYVNRTNKLTETLVGPGRPRVRPPAPTPPTPR